MSDADIPDRLGPAARWAIASIALFVFFLGASDTFREGQYTAGGIYSVLFIVTFFIAVKWKWLALFFAGERRRKLGWALTIAGTVGCLGFVGWGAYMLGKDAATIAEPRSGNLHPTAPTSQAPGLAMDQRPATELQPLSPYEAGKKLRGIDEYIAFLDSDSPSKVNDGQRLIDAWGPFKGGFVQSYEKDLNAYVSTLESVRNGLDQLRRKYPEYPDIIAFSEMPDVGKISLAAQYLRNFSHESDKYLSRSIDHGEFVVFVTPFSEQLRATIADYEHWRVATRERLLQMRRRISP
jgi:hypothetical protein